MRATDIVARLSGDEFAVLMPQTDTDGALQLGEDLRAQVAEGFPGDSELAAATISVGITMFGGKHEAGAEAVLVAADQAMYRAKAEGRNRIALFERPAERGAAAAARRQTTSARIRDALTQDRLSLATQPIRSLASGGVERYELLLRMTGESGELLPAAAFIGVAERSGMVQELDRWVVGQALDLLAERERAGEPVSLHVNLSGASLTDISVLEFIERRLDEGDADPGRCTFEITQTARVEDYETAAGFADRLTEFGCEVAIDDYGAGFGPFEYLKRDPLRRDQDRRRLHPRPAPQRRRPADREGDRQHRPAASARRRSPSSSRTRRPRRCCATTASTWPRATTSAPRSTPPRALEPGA